MRKDRLRLIRERYKNPDAAPRLADIKALLAEIDRLGRSYRQIYVKVKSMKDNLEKLRDALDDEA